MRHEILNYRSTREEYPEYNRLVLGQYLNGLPSFRILKRCAEGAGFFWLGDDLVRTIEPDWWIYVEELRCTTEKGE
jgi:hypothetical protein